MFRVYWLNHEYYAEPQFSTFDEAVAYAKSKCFEAVIVKSDSLKASAYSGQYQAGFWSPIGGLRDYRAA